MIRYFTYRVFLLLLLLAVCPGYSQQKINVVSPNGNESWEAQSDVLIQWNSSGVERVKIEYSLDNGLSWIIIAESADASAGEYAWTAADARTPYVLIRVTDSTNPSVYDISDQNFTITKTQNKSLNKPAAPSVRIMPVGDSITWGTNPDNPVNNGFRRSLFQQLVNAGFDVDFVGSLAGGSPADFDRDNEGHPGWYALRNTNPSLSAFHQLNSILTSNPPDIVLMHIGTNDVAAVASEVRTAAEIAAKVVDLLDIINTFNPNITIVLARIINRTDNTTFSAKTTQFNTALQQKADSLIALGRKIAVVNMESALSYPADMSSDNLHPDDNGYQKMADAWFPVLSNILSGQQNDCPTGLISYWKLDETSPGSYIDFAGGNNGSSTNSPVPVTGKVGGAQLFDGSTDEINIPADPSFNFAANQSFSIELWFNRPSASLPLGATEALIGRYDPSTGMRWYVAIDKADGKLIFYLRSPDGTNATIKGFPSVLDGQWHHLVVYREASTNNLRMYMDGLRRATGNRAFSTGFTSSAAALNIGWLSVNKSYTLQGAVDEAAIYNRVLTDTEITEHYNSGLSGSGYCGGSPAQTAPVITSSPVTAGEVGQPYSYDVNATGNPAPTFSLTTFPTGMTINTNTGLIQWSPGSTGNFNVTVQASNGVSPSANQSFTINVTSSSAPPVITSTPATSADAGQLYSYDVNATGNPAPTYTLVTFPSGMTINSASGLIQWTPSAAGDFSVEVQAANGINPPDNQSFVITVSDPGSPSCPPGIISYWKLDETSAGNYADFAGNNDGTSSTPPAPASGRVGGAQMFDGNNDQITVPADPSLDFGVNQSFSIEVWFNHPSMALPLSSTEIIIGRYDPSTGMRWFLWIDRIDGRPVCYLRSTNGTEATIKGWPSVLDAQWHHLVVYRDASTNNIRMYMDGLRRTTGNRAFTTGFTSSSAPVTIGWYTANINYTFEGRIDEAAVYNRILTDAEITEHYNNGLSGLGYCSGSGFASNSISSGFDSFDASNTENSVNLQWKITNGTAAGFEIEKKISEEHEWEKIDFIESRKDADLYTYRDNNLKPDGKISYRIKLINGNGSSTYSETKEVIVLPMNYQLFQNYPNPFNPVTTIKFALPHAGNVSIKIFNQLGEEVLQLVNGHYESGYHEVQFNGNDLASGVYFYRMESGSFSTIMKSLLLK